MIKHHRIFIGLITCLVLLSTACVSRVIRDVREHGQHNVTYLRTTDTTYFAGISFKRVDQFWTCTETPEQINCQRSCGGDTRHECREIFLGYTNMPVGD